MADVAPARGKRARSPSPGFVDTLASPLEVLLKRRRRSEWASATGFSGAGSSGNYGGTNNGTNTAAAGPSRMFAPPPPPVWQSTNDNTTIVEAHNDADNSSQTAASSPLRRLAPDYDDDETERTGFGRRAVERRRTRQWERLQDPSANGTLSAPHSASQPSSSAMYAHAHSYSQQHLRLHQQDGMSRSLQSSPAERQGLPRRGYATSATPERAAARNNMSSSPIRHNPPSSTPFRDDDWTEDERIREWGDEYSSQNSLLYSLHRARVEAIHASSPAAESPLVTPDPQRTAPQSVSHTHLTPYAQALPTPYRHHRTPLETPGLVSSDFASSPLVGPFSPMDGPAGPAPSPAQYSHMSAHEGEVVRMGYEEANRLLAALNVARMRRHDTHEEPRAGALQHAQQGNDGGAMDEQW